MVRKSLLIALLDGAPLRAEGFVLCEGEEALQLCQILQPDRLLDLERFRDERAQFGVALQRG